VTPLYFFFAALIWFYIIAAMSRAAYVNVIERRHHPVVLIGEGLAWPIAFYRGWHFP